MRCPSSSAFCREWTLAELVCVENFIFIKGFRHRREPSPSREAISQSESETGESWGNHLADLPSSLVTALAALAEEAGFCPVTRLQSTTTWG